MAGNPVSAFLQGFAAVDSLETNRQNREFQRENRSRLKTLWQRQDQQFERDELDRYRQEKLVEFDALTRDVVNRMESEDPGFLDADSKDGKPAGRVRVWNQVLNEMVQSDPEFGEHASEVFGLDAAGGSLVRDPTKPISGVGIFPASLSSDGKGGVFFEVDSINGMQPLTKNRTSAANDEIFLGEMGLRELTQLFGQGVMKNDLIVAEQLRNALNLSEVTGNPLASRDRTTTPAAGGEPQKDKLRVEVDPNPRIQSDEDFQANRDAFDAQKQELLEGAPAGFEPVGTDTVSDAQINAELPSFDNPPPTNQQGQQPSNRDQFEAQLKATLIDNNAPISSRVAAFTQLQGSLTNRAFQFFGLVGVDADQPTSSGEVALRAGAQGGIDAINAAGGFIVDVVAEVVTGEPLDTQGQGFNRQVEALILGNSDAATNEASLVSKEATSARDVIDAGAKPADFTADKVGQPGEAAGTALLTGPTFTSEAAVQGATNSISNTRGRPSTIQIYNATGLARLGVITPKQLTTYARTGQFDGATKPAFHFVTDKASGQTTVFRDGVATGRVRTGAGEDGAGSDEDRFDLATKLLEDFFVDRDGKPDKRAARIAVAKFDRAGDVLAKAFNDGESVMVDQNFANDFADGLSFVRNYEDPRFILNPAKLFDGRELADRSGLVGYLGVKLGIASQGDFDDFAFNFGIEFNDFANGQRWSEARKAAQIIEMERAHKDDRKPREEILEDLIEAAAKG